MAVAWLLAPYITSIYTGAPSRLDRLLAPLERTIYRLAGTDPGRGMGWKRYLRAAVLVNAVQMLVAFAVLVLQGVLPLNPMGFRSLNWDIALNTVVSFGTNANLQHYSGETTLSYLGQIGAIQFLQFTSAATGICIAVAVVRGLVAGSKDMGNFYVDFVRTLTRLLLPFCFVAALVLVSMGVPQTVGGYVTTRTVEGSTGSILVGPVASLVSIMQLGTNGGGYYGAGAASPFMNPSPESDILEISLMLLLPTALVFVFGQLLGKRRESRPILFGAYLLFIIDLAIALSQTTVLGPGIETRIGGFLSSFWTVTATAAGTGSLNAQLSAMHPLVILAALIGMLVQSAPGGVGVGLAYMMIYIVITVFVVGLMSGRTPEYLGVKITYRDVRLVVLAFLIHPIIILIPTVVAYASGAAAAIGLTAGSVGFTKVFYEFASAAANNGSDFLGASGNTLFFNLSTAAVILVGRYAPIGLMLALSGSVIGRKRASGEEGLKTESLAFSLVLVGSIIMLVVLSFLPFLALGPILSYLQGNVNALG